MKKVLLTLSSLTIISNAYELNDAIKDCEKGHANACSTAGFKLRGHDDAKSLTYYSKAVVLFSNACNSGSPDGCSSLSTMYQYGEGVHKNDDKAFELMVKAYKYWERDCENNDVKACTGQGTRYFSNYFLIAQNLSKGKYYTEKACEMNSAESCKELGFRYLNGFGLKRDINKSIMYLKKASGLGDEIAKEKLDSVCKDNPLVCKD